MIKSIQDFVIMEKKVRELQKIRINQLQQIKHYEQAMVEKDAQMTLLKQNIAVLEQQVSLLKQEIQLFQNKKDSIGQDFIKLKQYHIAVSASQKQQADEIAHFKKDNRDLQDQLEMQRSVIRSLRETIEELRQDKNELLARIQRHGYELRMVELEKLEQSLNDKSSFLNIGKENDFGESNFSETQQYHLRRRLEKLEEKLSAKQKKQANLTKKLGQLKGKLEKLGKSDVSESRIVCKSVLAMVEELISPINMQDN